MHLSHLKAALQLLVLLVGGLVIPIRAFSLFEFSSTRRIRMNIKYNRFESSLSLLSSSTSMSSSPLMSNLDEIIRNDDDDDEQKIIKKEFNVETINRRRTILNLLLLSKCSTLSQAANAFETQKKKKEAKAITATDITGNPIIASSFLSTHKSGDRTIVQGLKGDPTYLIVTKGEDGKDAAEKILKIESYALNAECTHLGCVVPWDPIQAKFICPCHGSQYDAMGNVIRGPAPDSLKLAKVEVEEETGKVILQPWIQNDFRSGEKPWWI